MTSPSELEVSAGVLERALIAHQAVPLHAHEQASRTADHLYQDHGSLMARLDTSEWQVIYGAGGAGKTAAIRTYAERTRRGGLTHRDPDRLLSTMAVYLDAHQFQPPHRAGDDNERAQAAFRLFLARFGSALIRTTQAMEGRQSIWPTLRRRTENERRSAANTVRDILAVVDQAQPTWPYISGTITTEQRDERSQEREARGGLSVGADSSGLPSASVDLGASAASRRKRSETTTRVSTGEGDPDWPLIRDMLETLCNGLGVERIDILIDNWPELDRDGTGAVQPYFADLLARSLMGSERVSVKIATDGLQTVLWSRTLGRGLEVGRHISEVENLNHALLSDHALVTFFERLLFRRMLKDTDALRAFVDPHIPNEPVSPRFVLAVFESRDAFELLVHGTEGRPRLFLHCFRSLAHRSGFSARPRWTADQVLDVVQGRHPADVDDLQHYSDATVMLLSRIKPHVTATNAPYFAVTREDAARNASALEELHAKRLVDRAPPEQQKEAQVFGKVMLTVSESLMAEWERARVFEHRLQMARDHAPTVPRSIERRLDQITLELNEER